MKLIYCLIFAPFLKGCLNKDARPTEIIYLIDKTVKDKRRIVTKLDDKIGEFQTILESRDNQRLRKYLNTRLLFSYIDDLGANDTSVICEIHKDPGKKFLKAKENLGHCIDEFRAIVETILADSKKYRRSMIVESLASAIEKIKSSKGKVLVISDFNLEDDTNHFERGLPGDFTKPIFINPDHVNIQLDYIANPGEQLIKTNLIKAWWFDTISGAETFDSVFNEYKRHYMNLPKTKNNSRVGLSKEPNLVSNHDPDDFKSRKIRRAGK